MSIKWWFTLLASMLLMTGCDAPTFHNTDISGATYGRTFELLDPEGKIRHLDDFRGKAVMVFFGFIQCPDVCPTTLLRAREVHRLLGEQGNRMQVIFITLDPERDTPEILREYIAAFGSEFLGLYTTPEKTRAIAEDFRIYYRKVPTGNTYTLDHTAITYLYDPDGQLRLAISHQASAEDIAADVAMLLHNHSSAQTP
ncbi:MAG: SCO family protein [Azoarcus sp.]|jgi:protein SCO1/2|nr:SCO family protein [Azoarcus sp.]